MELYRRFALHHDNGRLGLANADDDPVDVAKTSKQRRNDIVAQSLDQPRPLPLEGRFHHVIDIGIGNRVTDSVGLARRAQVDPAFEIDEKALAQPLFLGKQAMEAIKAEIAENDAVARKGCSH
ncbi:hypothetical protein D3C71_1862020 [compost metagenome]